MVCTCGKEAGLCASLCLCAVHMGLQSLAFFSDTLSVGVHGRTYLYSLLPKDLAATPTLTGGGSARRHSYYATHQNS